MSTTPRLGIQLWARSANSLRQSATHAETVGFTNITVPDHLSERALPPFIAATILVEATQHAQIGVLVLNNDLHHPTFIARSAAALADLSGGRFELGLGAGHMRHECERIGRPFDPPATRIERLTEAVQLIQRLLSGETLEHAGTHYTLSGETTWPTIQDTVPILIGGNTQALLACAAAHADTIGFTGFTPRRGGTTATADAFEPATLSGQITRARELAGDRPRRMHALIQWVDITPRRAAAAERAAKALDITPELALTTPYALIGSTREIAQQLLERTEQFGIDYWTVFEGRPEEPDTDTINALAPTIQHLT